MSFGLVGLRSGDAESLDLVLRFGFQYGYRLVPPIHQYEHALIDFPRTGPVVAFQKM